MSLEQHRERIDEIDKQLVELLEQRFEISKKVGEWKKENGQAVENLEREREIINSKTSSLPKEFVKEFFQLIFKQSKEMQR